MTADITEQDIEHVAKAMSAEGPGQSGHILSGMARAALEAAAEIGWGRKPTEAEVAGLFLSNCVYAPYEIAYKMLKADYAVENPEWEPTDEAVEYVRHVWDFSNSREQVQVVLKLIRANPHLIGLEGE